MSGRPSRQATTAVCVPIRNEAALLPHFLDALAAQRVPFDFVLCALFDGCTDDSAAIVREQTPALPFAVVTAEAGRGEPNAGLARRRAMAIGLSVIDSDAAMIVSTDADSVPSNDWLAANRAALDRADIATGRVVRAGGRVCPVQDRLEAYYDALYELRRSFDPVPWEAPRTHHCTSSASLAFRAGAYRALGGFDALAFGEDARLVDRAYYAGLRVRRDAAIAVTTSARRTGRATGGLADHLRALDRGGSPAMVAHPRDVAWRYARHAIARAAWTDREDRRGALSTTLGCDVADVERVAAEAGNAEAFAMRIVPTIPGGERLVTLDEAETALATLRDARQELAA